MTESEPATSAHPDAGPWPHVLPYLAFGLVLTVAGSASAPGLLAQVAVPAALLLFFAQRGDYPELARTPPGAPHPDAGRFSWLGDVALGLAIAALWLAPFLVFEGLPRPAAEGAFDHALLGSAAATLAVRFVGFALVTPFMEELFVRSFLLRFIDVFDQRADFRSLPIGRFAWRSFLGTSAWFMVTHQTWEWVVALPTGILLNLWLYRRRRLGAVVLAHAVANAAIFAFVVLLGPGRPDLWIFL